MARNGSGTYSLPQAPFVPNSTISSAAVNSDFSDIAAALTQSISKDGQTVYTSNQPMGGNKLTGLGVGTSAADSVAVSQLYGVPTYGGVGGNTADVITIVPSPGIAAYAIGQKFSFKASGTNTGAVTLNVNGIGAGAVTWANGTALAAGDITSGGMYEVEVQATTPVFHLQTPRAVNLSTTGPTTQNLTSGTGATYTTAVGAKWISVRMVGAGGGGGGVGGTTAPTGATGGTTTFNSVTAIGGTGGTSAISNATETMGGAGGTGGTGSAANRFPGSAGQPGVNYFTVSALIGGEGGASAFGAGPTSVTASGSTVAGTSAAANTGAGGSGAGGQVATIAAAAGGGSGEYVELIIVNPSATYTYTIGAGGAGGIGTGTNAATGGAGGSGFITVEEHYNYG